MLSSSGPSGKPHPETTGEIGHRDEVIIPTSANTFPSLATLSSELPRLSPLGEWGKGDEEDKATEEESSE